MFWVIYFRVFGGLLRKNEGINERNNLNGLVLICFIWDYLIFEFENVVFINLKMFLLNVLPSHIKYVKKCSNRNFQIIIVKFSVSLANMVFSLSFCIKKIFFTNFFSILKRILLWNGKFLVKLYFIVPVYMEGGNININ